MAWKSLPLPGCQWQVKGFNERISPAEKISCHPGVDTAASWQRLRILKGSLDLHVMRMGGLLLLDDFFGDFACDL